MEVTNTIDVNYTSSNDLDTIRATLSAMPPLIACDFETSSRYTEAQRTVIRTELDNPNLNFIRRAALEQQLSATGLSHPSHTFPTHLSIATSESDAFVVIIDTHEILDLVMGWLVETEVTQIWHNA